jgi:DNA-binding MarR family transcriptional regulator
VSPASVPAPPTPAPAPVDPAGLASRLRLAVARLNRRVRHEGNVSGEELTASSMAALATIERAGPIALGELAAIEQVQPPSLTRIVARLEDEGYVTRAVDAADRRVARAAITPAGRRFLAASRTRKEAFLAQRVARLPLDEQVALARALPVLERLLEEDPPS